MTFNEWSLSHGRHYWYSEFCIPSDTFHEPILGHQLNILGQNAISDLYIFDHKRVDISLGSMLERFTRQSKVDHSEIWSFVKCGFLPSSCISQWRSYTNSAHWEKKILAIHLGKISDGTCVDCWQYIPLNDKHDLTMIILLSDNQFIWH